MKADMFMHVNSYVFSELLVVCPSIATPEMGQDGQIQFEHQF